MLLNKDTWPQHRRWLFAVLLIAGLLTLSYIIYHYTYSGLVDGGTLPGIIYGSIALAIMIFDSILGARRKVPAWRIGRMSTWLNGHVWISLLLFPLVFFHSAFRIGGTFTLVLWVFFFIVMLSGMVGVLFQTYLPQLMTDTVAMETIYDQIDHITHQLRYDADVKVVQAAGGLGFDLNAPEGITPVKVKEPNPLPEGSEDFKNHYLKNIRPLFETTIKIKKVLRTQLQIQELLEAVSTTVPEHFHQVLRDILPLLEEKRQLEVQKTLHHWMHGWLFVHVPVSYAFLILTIIHAVTALWY